MFDHFADGSLDDMAMAKRMRLFLTRGTPKVALRTLKLYDSLADEKKETFRKHGLSPGIVEKSRRKFIENNS